MTKPDLSVFERKKNVINISLFFFFFFSHICVYSSPGGFEEKLGQSSFHCAYKLQILHFWFSFQLNFCIIKIFNQLYWRCQNLCFIKIKIRICVFEKEHMDYSTYTVFLHIYCTVWLPLTRSSWFFFLAIVLRISSRTQRSTSCYKLCWLMEVLPHSGELLWLSWLSCEQGGQRNRSHSSKSVFMWFQGSPSYELQTTVEGCALVTPLVLSALSKANGADWNESGVKAQLKGGIPWHAAGAAVSTLWIGNVRRR